MHWGFLHWEYTRGIFIPVSLNLIALVLDRWGLQSPSL